MLDHATSQDLLTAAKFYLQQNPSAKPTFSSHAGMVFNDNEDADDINDFLVDIADQMMADMSPAEMALIVRQAIIELDRPMGDV